MSLRTLLMVALLYAMLLTVLAFALPLQRVLGARIDREVRTQARTDAALVAAVTGPGAPSATLRSVVQTAASASRGRVIVVDRNGLLKIDSARPPAATGTDYSSRPEVASALRGTNFQERRNSESLGLTLLVTATPARTDGKVSGAVRVSQDVGAIGRAVTRARLALLLLGLLVLAVGAIVAAVLARRLAAPLSALEDAAGAVAEGDMTVNAPERGSREQVAVARAFNAMTHRVDTTLTAQQQFVANASHQLRTPLTGVRLRIEEALAEDLQPAVAADLVAATQEVDRLSALVDDLLALGRAGERGQTARPVDLTEVAAAVAERLRATAAREDRSIVVSSVNPAVALADPDDVERALEVLAENALRYGKGEIEFVVLGTRVEVRDRGPGLAAGEDDGRLLERFHRGSASRHQPGNGLGLSIASTLAARWGGRVGLESRSGGGAVAFLDFTGAGL